MGAGMPKAYSRDLRERVITAVETGASRREAAERFEVSVACGWLIALIAVGIGAAWVIIGQNPFTMF